MRLSINLFLVVLSICLAAPAAMAQEITLNRVVAVVNGDPITMHELELQSMPAFARDKINPNDPANKDKVDEILKGSLEEVIIDRLISQDAERLGIKASESDVDAEIQNIMKRNNIKTQMEFERALSAQGLDMPTFRQKMRNNLINSRLTNQMVARQILIPSSDIEKYYAEHKEEFIDREVDLQILVFNPAMKPAEIQHVAKAVKNGKVSFAEAVQKCSIGPASDTDGKVENMNWRGLAPQIRATLETAQIGQVTDVLNVDGQPMMFILLRLTEPTQKSLDDVRGEIENTLKMPLAKARFDEYVSQLRNKAVIDIRM